MSQGMLTVTTPAHKHQKISKTFQKNKNCLNTHPSHPAEDAAESGAFLNPPSMEPLWQENLAPRHAHASHAVDAWP